jgi:hypothetical protein
MKGVRRDITISTPGRKVPLDCHDLASMFLIGKNFWGCFGLTKSIAIDPPPETR